MYLVKVIGALDVNCLVRHVRESISFAKVDLKRGSVASRLSCRSVSDAQHGDFAAHSLRCGGNPVASSFQLSSPTQSP